MTKLVRYWLANRLEWLALRLGNREHGLGCSGTCPCWQAGRADDWRPL